mgnify:FL=1
MPEQQKTILIIEDDESLLEAIEHECISRGFRALRARSVIEGLSILESIFPIHVVWLDHYLIGKTNGLDFVAQVKNRDAWKQIPIFVVSNNEGIDSIQSYMHLGVNQYYTKADYDLKQIILDIEDTLSKPATP